MIKNRILLLAALVFLLPSLSAQAAKPKLVVYTYDSFTSDWGPGPKVKKAFEQECLCELELVGLEDGVSLLTRLKLEGKNTKADVILGIDTNLTVEAKATGLFAEHGMSLNKSSLPEKWTDTTFLPYDYGYFAFVYNKELLKKPPTSFSQLVDADNDLTILIQDPRSSTPGLGLLLWVKKIYGDESDQAWKSLSKKVVTVSKGWSEAYGLFLKGEAAMVLSYSTSPAYHVIAEEDERFAAADFSEGHYQQIEVAGLIKHSKQKALAKKFLKFMLSEKFQKIIPTNNWMYPANLPASQLPAPFKNLIDPKPALIIDSAKVAKNRKKWVNQWLEVMSN